MTPAIDLAVKAIESMAKMPTEALKLLITGLDSEAMRKLAEWADAYVSEINRMTPPPAPDAGEPRFDDNFLDVMKGTTFHGERLSFQDLEIAANAMAKAIKAENWKQALWVGLSVAAKAGVA